MGKRVATLAFLLAAATSAGAACIGVSDGALAALEVEAFRSPTEFLLDAPRYEASRERLGDLSVNERATLRAMSGEAHRQLEHVTAALAAANVGLAIPGLDRRSSTGIRLRLLHALALDDSNATPTALAELDALVAQESSDPRALACAKKDRGWIRDSVGDADGALRDLIAAHAYLAEHGPQDEAMVAAGRLASLYRVAGEYDVALQLITQSLDYFTSICAWVRVGTAHDRRGRILLAQHRYATAVDEFRELRRVSVQVGDRGGAAFADLRTCEAQLELGRLSDAYDLCKAADSEFAQLDTMQPSNASMLHELFGRIALGRGNYTKAVIEYSAAIASGAVELKGGLGVKVYHGLAEAEGHLGHDKAAYVASQEYEQRLIATQNQQTVRELAVMRIRADLDRQLATNTALTDERHALLERNTRTATERNVVLGVGSLILLATIGGFWLSAKKRVADTARRAAEQRAEELGRLCAGVAHDFNNLMTVVQQAVGLLGRDLDNLGHSDDRVLVEAVREAAATGGAITRQLLAFGRQQDMRPAVLECAFYFASIGSLLRQAVGGSTVVAIRPPEPSVTIWADSPQLTSALINLVLNARDAGASPGTVTISATPDPNGAATTTVAVSDTGTGMSPEVLKRCTEVFYSTKEPGRGSGLGLSAVQGFVIQAGGELRIDSAPGRGTTVMMILPSRAPRPRGRGSLSGTV